MTGIVLGIDPGRHAYIGILGRSQPEIWKIDTQNELDLFRDRLLRLRQEGPIQAWLERVSSHPGEGVRSAFTFGRSVGALHGMLVALNIPIAGWVSPTTWQRLYSVPAKLNCPDRKRFLRGRAAEIFPQIKITLQNADALLIAHWAVTTRQRQE